MKLSDIIQAIEDEKVQCDKCEGKGVYDHEYWTNLYEERTCNICKGTGKRLGPEAWKLRKILIELL